MRVVIQCGGQGTRLRPYTMVLPKPLMPVKAQPVLELLLKWLRRNDIQDVYITTGYLGNLIRSVFGDGSQWDMRIKYTEEKEALGTIGPLTLLREELQKTFLVINGDVLTDLNIHDFVQTHRNRGGHITVATAVRKTKMEFGVMEQFGGRIKSFREKPILTNQVSMGIYCMEPQVLEHIPAGVPFGFDDLILRMLARDLPAYTYLHDGFWLDIGRVEDFQTAQELSWDNQAPAFQVVAAA